MSFHMSSPPPSAPLFPYTTLFRSRLFPAASSDPDLAEEYRRLGQQDLADTKLADLQKIGRAHVLNSSHVAISYAVFCLKKKKTRHSARSGTQPRQAPHRARYVLSC